MKTSMGFGLFVLAPLLAAVGFAGYAFLGLMTVASEKDRAQAQFMNTCVTAQEQQHGWSNDIRVKAIYSEQCWREWRGR